MAVRMPCLLRAFRVYIIVVSVERSDAGLWYTEVASAVVILAPVMSRWVRRVRGSAFASEALAELQ